MDAEATDTKEIIVTEKMRDAGAGAYYAGDLRFESAGEIAEKIYRAMVNEKISTNLRSPLS